MPRKARDERLDTRTGRLKLKPRREPYWRSIQDGRAIGYRRAPAGKAGTWIARHYEPVLGRRFQALGAADDYLPADGVDTLTFSQAQDRANEWFRALGRQDGKTVEPITVKQAVEHYLRDYAARGGKSRRLVEITAEAHILPQLGDKRLRLADGANSSGLAPLARQRPGAPQNVAKGDHEEDEAYRSA